MGSLLSPRRQDHARRNAVGSGCIVWLYAPWTTLVALRYTTTGCKRRGTCDIVGRKTSASTGRHSSRLPAITAGEGSYRQSDSGAYSSSNPVNPGNTAQNQAPFRN